MSNKEPQNDEVFTRLRQDAPCGSTGRIGLRQRLRPDRDGDRRPRRSPQGEAGLASAQFRLALSQMPRAEARGASLRHSIFLVRPARNAFAEIRELAPQCSFVTRYNCTAKHSAWQAGILRLKKQSLKASAYIAAVSSVCKVQAKEGENGVRGCRARSRLFRDP